jgi:hypothetical protein
MIKNFALIINIHSLGVESMFAFVFLLIIFVNKVKNWSCHLNHMDKHWWVILHLYFHYVIITEGDNSHELVCAKHD